MKTFWSLFWRIFGAVLVVMFARGCILGIIKHSADVVYTLLQQTIAFGLGVCGIIGLVVIPIELYFEDRNQRGPHVTK
jgi:hypothetical protein